MSVGRGSGRGRSGLPTEQGAQHGARSQDPEIMTWAEGRHLADGAAQVLLQEEFMKKDLFYGKKIGKGAKAEMIWGKFLQPFQ